MSKEIKFWGSEGDEYLTYTKMDDAIESVLDDVENIKDLPETIEVCGYAHMDLPKRIY